MGVEKVASRGVLVYIDLTERRASGVAREAKRPNVRVANIMRMEEKMKLGAEAGRLITKPWG